MPDGDQYQCRTHRRRMRPGIFTRPWLCCSATICSSGYKHFVMDHLWTSKEELFDLDAKLREVDPNVEIRTFLLFVLWRKISVAFNSDKPRGLDEHEFESRTVFAERNVLYRSDNTGLGELFDVSAGLKNS